MGMRVLAVDDDPVCLKVLESLLRKCEYHGQLIHLLFLLICSSDFIVFQTLICVYMHIGF